MTVRHSESLLGVYNALVKIAENTKGKNKSEELKMLARQVHELRGYWRHDEDAAEMGRSGKRVPMKTQYKSLIVGHMTDATVEPKQMDDALASLAVEGWKVIFSHADVTGAPKWAILLKREIQA